MKTSHIILVGIILLLIGVIIRLSVNYSHGNKSMGPGDRSEYSQDYGKQKDMPKDTKSWGDTSTKSSTTNPNTTTNSGVISSVTLPFLSSYTAERSQVALVDLPAINTKSHNLGATYTTRFNSASETAPNFAGKYSIVVWGCGSSCGNGAIVNRETGQILGQLPLIAERDYLFSVDSRLLVINPYFNDNYLTVGDLATHYYEWTGASFKHIGSYYITKNSITVAPKP